MIESYLTKKQQEALRLITEKQKIFLYGGSRSGKTLLILLIIIYLAHKYQGSRHLVARLRFAHAKTAIWLDSLKKAFEIWQIKPVWKESDHYVMVGDSEIWIDGLDDRDRVDKILGREYMTIFFNEISQIPYSTITTVLTRLAQKVVSKDGKIGTNYEFYDCNPPSKFHWSYKLFIQGIDPASLRLISKAKQGVLQMNPVDNQEHLPENYIQDTLESLPEHKRKRFLEGEFTDAQGVIFNNWKIYDDLPEEVERRARVSYGLDFGFTVNPTALIACYLYGNDLYLDELIYSEGLTNQNIASLILGMGLDLIYADSAEPKSIEELRRARLDVRGAKKGPDSLRQGIDWLLSKNLYVSRRSVNLLAELQNYVWKQNRDGRALPEPIDDWNHAIDAVRYGCEPFRRGIKKVNFTAAEIGL